jgi:CBS domain-containing protein
VSSTVATVADAMRPRVPGCTLRTPVMEVARRLQDEGARRMVVASAGSDLIAGTIGELELLRAVIDGMTEGMASDVMNLDAPATIEAVRPLSEAVRRMGEEGVDFFVVVAGEPARPVGVLSHAELAAFMAAA